MGTTRVVARMPDAKVLAYNHVVCLLSPGRPEAHVHRCSVTDTLVSVDTKGGYGYCPACDTLFVWDTYEALKSIMEDGADGEAKR